MRSHKRTAILPRTEVVSQKKKKEGGRRDGHRNGVAPMQTQAVGCSWKQACQCQREQNQSAKQGLAPLTCICCFFDRTTSCGTTSLCLDPSSRLGSTRLRAFAPPNSQRRRLPDSVPSLISVSGSIISAAGRLGDAGSGVPRQGPYFWDCVGCVWVCLCVDRFFDLCLISALIAQVTPTAV